MANQQDLHRRSFLIHLHDRDGFGRPVLLKQPAHDQPTRAHLDQLHNEFAITMQLAGVTGVRPGYAMEGSESQPVLLSEYVRGGQSLAELIRSASIDMAEKLRLALNMAMALHLIHERQVMHKDISSGNILVAENDESGSQDDGQEAGYSLQRRPACRCRNCQREVGL